MSRWSVRPADFACVRHLLLFSAAETVIGAGCELGGLSLRASLPGCSHQVRTRRLARHRASGLWQVLAVMWCSTMSARDIGSSRVIPGWRPGPVGECVRIPGQVVVRVLDRVRLTATGRPH